MSDPAASRAPAVGKQLAQRRKDMGLTQERLAGRLPIGPRTVSAIERGENVIQLGLRAEWEHALRLEPGTLTRAYMRGTPIEALQMEAPTRADTPSLPELAAEVAELRQRVNILWERDHARSASESADQRTDVG